MPRTRPHKRSSLSSKFLTALWRTLSPDHRCSFQRRYWRAKSSHLPWQIMSSHLLANLQSTTQSRCKIKCSATRTAILSWKLGKVDSLTLHLSHCKTRCSISHLLIYIKARAMRSTSLATCRSIKRFRGLSGPIMHSLMFRSRQISLYLTIHRHRFPIGFGVLVCWLTKRSSDQSAYPSICSLTISGFLSGALKTAIFPHGFSLWTKRLIKA